MDSVTVGGAKKRKKSSKHKSEKRPAVQQEVDEAPSAHPPARQQQQQAPAQEQSSEPRKKKKKSQQHAKPAASEDAPDATSTARADKMTAGVDAIVASIQGTGPKVEQQAAKTTDDSAGADETPAEKPKSFKELGVCEELCTAVAAMGWKASTPIQSEAVPFALEV